MANRYWVGGTASWDGTAGTKWALTSGGAGGQAVPTTADDVFFDGNSGANTVTIATGNTGCKSLTCTGFTGTLTGSADLTIAGGFTFVAGMTSTLTGRFLITGTGTLTSAGKTLPFLNINGAGITVDQADDFTFTTTPAVNAACITLVAGTYNTNNHNITFNCSASSNTGGGIDVSNATSTRAINLGSSTINIIVNSNNNIPFFGNSTNTNLTFNAGTSTIICKNLGGSSSAFQGNGLTFYNVTFENTSATAIPITGSNTFNNLTFNGRTVAGLGNYTLDSNQTVTGTLTVSAGTDASMRSFLKSNTAGTARTLTCAAVSLTDVDFQDITGAGAATWTGTRIGNCKGNSNITFTTAKQVYWNLAGAQNWNAVGWATSSGGTPAANNFPLAQDTATFDNTGSVTGTITVNTAWNVGTVDMSARTSAMTLSLSSGVIFSIYGNWVNGSGTTLSGARTLTFSGRGSQTITSAGKTFAQSIKLDSIGGTLQLQDNLTTSLSGGGGSVQLANGTLDLNGKTLTASSTGGSVATLTGTKNITFNGGTISINGTSTTAFNNAQPIGFTTTAGTGTGTITLTGATAKTFVGGDSTFNCTLNQGGAGALTVTGANTFNDITSTYTATAATTITLPASTTTTVNNFTASGTVGKLLTLQSSTAGTQATLSKASGTVNVNYVSIKDSAATGGAIWNAFLTNGNVNAGNNTGWDLSGTVNGNGFLFGSNF